MRFNTKAVKQMCSNFELTRRKSTQSQSAFLEVDFNDWPMAESPTVRHSYPPRR